MIWRGLPSKPVKGNLYAMKTLLAILTALIVAGIAPMADARDKHHRHHKQYHHRHHHTGNYYHHHHHPRTWSFSFGPRYSPYSYGQSRSYYYGRTYNHYPRSYYYSRPQYYGRPTVRIYGR
jgi:hypothetical protein